MIRHWVKIALLFLIIAGLLGATLRLNLIYPLGVFNYKFFLHTHSHVMLLGWVFNALFAGLLVACYGSVENIPRKYPVLFWIFQISVLGMLFTFPFQGYAAGSIVFSTFHILLSFIWVYLIFKDSAFNKLKQLGQGISYRFLQLSLLFLLLSAVGPFTLAALMFSGDLAGSQQYDLAVYFYLHFQYNGWISFAVFGLFFWLLETKGLSFNRQHGRNFLLLMGVACVPAYALSALWTRPPLVIYLIGGLAALLQVVALLYFWGMLMSLTSALKKLFSPIVQRLMGLAFAALTIKIILQFLSAFPMLADLAYQVRTYTIGYLHLVFLGFFTLFLLAWFLHMRLISMHNLLLKAGMILFLFGFVGSELYLVLPPWLGLSFPYYHQILFGLSLSMPLGLLPLLLSPVPIRDDSS